MSRTRYVVLALGLTAQQGLAHAEDIRPPVQTAQVVVASAEQTPARPSDTRAATAELIGLALRHRVSIAHDRSGYGVPAPHCRKAAEGCDQRMFTFAEYMVDAAQARGIDPWLLAAMAVRESSLDPFAVGGVGELGILQINPSRRDAKQVRFMRDAAYRRTCRKAPGACQREIVEHAAHILEQSMNTCRGKLRAALGAYNSGRCTRSKDYAARVLKERTALKAAAHKAAARNAQRLSPVPAAPSPAPSKPALRGAIARNDVAAHRTPAQEPVSIAQ